MCGINKSIVESSGLLYQCMTSTLQLFSYEAGVKDLNNPNGVFGGCIYKDWLFSVLHGTSNLKYEAYCFVRRDAGGPVYLKLNPEFMSLMPIYEENPQLTFIDFLYQKISRDIQFEGYYRDDDTDDVINFPIHRFSTLASPNLSDLYYFFGNTRGTICRVSNEITYKSIFRRLEYCSEVDGFMLEFELDEPIADSNSYKGASGAPIVDKDGNLVSLVVSGIPGTRVLHGVNLIRLGHLVEALSENGIG